MKKTIKFISLLMAVLMLASALPITAFAAGAKQYIKEVRISTASTESEAKQWLITNGYQVLDVNLNQKSNGDAVYLGYITTTNPDEAITDMAIMQMDGGYSFADYEAMIKEREEDINFLLDSLASSIRAARENYQNGYKGAVKAHEFLNMFVEDDSGKLLGDLIFVENFDKSTINKVFLQGNSDVTMIVYNMLALACVEIGDDTNWLAKLENIDPYGEYDPLVYEELARKTFPSFEEIHDMLAYYDLYCKEINENPEAIEGMTEEELADYYPEDYQEATFLYAALTESKYGNGTLADFFAKDPNEIDLEELYPILAAMTEGERDISVVVGLTTMIAMALNDTQSLDKYFENYKKDIEYYAIDGKISVYFGVDRSLFEGGVALTNAALRESASTGDSSWYSEDNIDKGLSIALGCLAGASVTTAITVACSSQKILAASVASSEAFISGISTSSCLASVADDAAVMLYRDFMLRGIHLETVIPNFTGVPSLSSLKAAIPADIASANADLIATADAKVAQAEGKMVAQATEAKNAVASRTMGAIQTVAYVAIGISLLIEAVRIGIKLYNYYHPEYTEIPRIIVSETSDENGSTYVNYYVALDQNGEYADLNAWKGQRWNALYTTKDKEAGDPILASGLTAKVKDNSMPSTDSYGVHYFGETGACNVSRYLLKKTAPATYMFFTRDHSLSTTASVFSQGTVIAFTGIGLLGGIAVGSLGVIGAGKMKKKKDEKAQSEEEQVNA